MKLAIDVMGFENDISEAIKACRKFKKNHSNVEFILVGKEDEIKQRLKSSDNFQIVNATDVIDMNDNPVLGIRKTQSSMYKAIELVKNNDADGVLSAGSSTCYVPLTYLLLGKINGVSKPAFMPYLPTTNKRGMLMLDVGANKECTGEDLYIFAKMASIFSQRVRNIDSPKIGVINIGTEVDKGFAYHKDAFNLISADKSINFVGFVEPRDLLNGVVDVAVTDGFVGNITLKSLEGGLSALKNSLKKEYKKFWNWLGALTSIFALHGLSKTFDYKNNAGAFVIGLKKIAVKTHGSADEQQFFSSIRMLYEAIQNDVIVKIAEEFSKR